MTIAAVTNVGLSAADGRRRRNQPLGSAASAKPAEQPAAMATEEKIAERRPWVVMGRVTDAQGQPIEGATVRATAG